MDDENQNGEPRISSEVSLLNKQGNHPNLITLLVKKRGLIKEKSPCIAIKVVGYSEGYMSLARRCLTTVAVCAASLGIFGSPATATPIPAAIAQLRTQLSIAIEHAPGHVGIALLDLTTGLSAGVNESADMPAASTIKIPVMVEVFRQMESGSINLNDQMHLAAADKDDGSGDIYDAPVGRAYTVNVLLHAMIDESDNTAANMLIRLVHRDNVNHTMHELGLHQTQLRSDIRTGSTSIRYALRTSPSDMVHLLAKMAQRTLIDPWASQQMFSILANQQINTLLPVPLPHDLTIAHKTGSLHDTLNDVGIVASHAAPYVIAVLTTQLPSLDEGRSFIRQVSLLAYESFQQLATWRQDQGLPAFAFDENIGVPKTRRVLDEVAAGPNVSARPPVDGLAANSTNETELTSDPVIGNPPSTASTTDPVNSAPPTPTPAEM